MTAVYVLIGLGIAAFMAWDRFRLIRVKRDPAAPAAEVDLSSFGPDERPPEAGDRGELRRDGAAG